MKNFTSRRNSLGEKLNVGMCTCRYGRTPLRLSPHCGRSLPLLWSFAAGAGAFAAGLAVAFGEAAGDAEDEGAADDEGVIGFSPGCISEGSFRNRISQSGLTRAPSEVSIGG